MFCLSILLTLPHLQLWLSLSLQFPMPASKVFSSNFQPKNLLKFVSRPSLPPHPLPPPPLSLQSTTPNYGLWLAVQPSHRELPLKEKEMTSPIKKEPQVLPLCFKHHLHLLKNPLLHWVLPRIRSLLDPLWLEGAGLRKKGGATRCKHLIWTWRLRIYWASSPLRNSKAKRYNGQVASQ